MGCHFLLQGIFPKPGSPALQAGSLQTEPPGKPDSICRLGNLLPVCVNWRMFVFFSVQIVPHVVNLVHSFKSDGLPSSTAFLVQLTELIHCMMYHYSGFPDLYEPILEAIKVWWQLYQCLWSCSLWCDRWMRWNIPITSYSIYFFVEMCFLFEKCNLNCGSIFLREWCISYVLLLSKLIIIFLQFYSTNNDKAYL